ncbi:uncharacterized protein LOC135399321 isoform X2 [Ornithodoros turicata]|uniref:uncharacterized protein LOC135399321 isoform X2 n=1 Tax=Ornithodoros turicata TaxID=34597 RepID=UPI00313A1CBC
MATIGEGTPLLVHENDVDVRLQVLPGYLRECCCCTTHVRRCEHVTGLEWLFFGVSLVAIMVSLGFTCTDLSQFPNESDDYILGWVILFITVMSIPYIGYGVIAKASLADFIAYSLNMAVLFTYSFISYYYNETDPENLGRLAAVVVLWFMSFVVGIWAMCKHTPWQRFTFHLSSREDDGVKLMICSVCKSIIMVVVQCQFSMLIFIADPRFRTKWIEIGAHIAAGVVTVVFFICGVAGINYERQPVRVFFGCSVDTVLYDIFRKMEGERVSVGVILLCSCLIVAYDVFRLVDVLLKWPCALYRVAISTCACFGFGFTILVICCTWKIWRNSGKGVKDNTPLVPVGEGTSFAPTTITDSLMTPA